MALQLLGEHPLAEGDRLFFLRGMQARRAPRLLPRLDDEGGALAVVLVGVDTPQAVVAGLEIEGEGRERPRGAEPHEAVRSGVDRGLEVVAVALAQARVH